MATKFSRCVCRGISTSQFGHFGPWWWRVFIWYSRTFIRRSALRLLLRAASGIVAYGCGSPTCRDYSRLKLKPNSPRAIRTPDRLSGIPGLTPSERQCIHDSYTMLSRTVMVLTLVYLSGGHVHLEQPQNAMSWLEQVVQSFIRQISPHCVIIAACCYGASWDKAWLLATSFPPIQTLAGLCPHPRGTHESVIGTRGSSWWKFSRLNGCFPGITRTWTTQKYDLGGGFNYFVFSPQPGEMIQFDQSFSNGLKPPTSFASTFLCTGIDFFLVCRSPWDLLSQCFPENTAQKKWSFTASNDEKTVIFQMIRQIYHQQKLTLKSSPQHPWYISLHLP